MEHGTLIERDQIVSSLSIALRDGKIGLKHVPELLKITLRKDCWRERIVHQTGEIRRFERFEQFVTTGPPEGLGATLNLVRKIVRDDPEAENLLDQATVREPGNPTGENQYTESGTVDIINSSIQPERPTGTTRQYAIRRLRRERPDLLQKVLDQELSPHAAMLEGGFRERKISIPIDPERAARTIKKHFDREQLLELIDWLQS